MSREIKFRAWHKEKKVMQPVLQFDWYVNSGCTNQKPSNISTCWLTPKNGDIAYEFELMQYTGLKDKNGKEIYEGDVLIHCMANTSVEIFTFVVEYCEEKACYLINDQKTKGKYYFLLGDINDEYIVCSNIYEKLKLVK